jgi:hypothetical protein
MSIARIRNVTVAASKGAVLHMYRNVGCLFRGDGRTSAWKPVAENFTLVRASFLTSFQESNLSSLIYFLFLNLHYEDLDKCLTQFMRARKIVILTRSRA